MLPGSWDRNDNDQGCSHEDSKYELQGSYTTLDAQAADVVTAESTTEYVKKTETGSLSLDKQL